MANSPERIGLSRSQYETHFSSLKKTAKLSKQPWSGNYWPSYKGGISYRWNHPNSSNESRVFYRTKPADELDSKDISSLSPSEKLDLLRGDDEYSITKFERRRTQVLRQKDGHEIPHWFGLCHSWAPATIFYESPKPVTMTRYDGLKIPFGASDVKALLVFFLNQKSSRDYFVSRRCNIDDKALRKKVEKGHMTQAEYRRQMESANCIGVNPGAFHVILANMIGERDEGFVADVTRDAEVWNQAIHAYSSRVLETREDSFSRDADPRTVKEVKVATSMHYTSEISTSWYDTTGRASTATANYQYWLELDKDDDIIGGTWISHKRPDFLWKRAKPSFSGNYSVIGDIYEKSVGPAPEREGGSRSEVLETLPTSRAGIISLDMFEKKKVTAGYTYSFSGVLSKKVKKLKVRYYNKRGKKIHERRIRHHRDRTFERDDFFFRFAKVDRVEIVALDKKKRVLDILKVQL